MTAGTYGYRNRPKSRGPSLTTISQPGDLFTRTVKRIANMIPVEAKKDNSKKKERGHSPQAWFDAETISRVRWLLEYRHVLSEDMAQLLGVKRSYVNKILTYNNWIYADPIRPSDEWIADLRAGKFRRPAAQIEAE